MHMKLALFALLLCLLTANPAQAGALRWTGRPLTAIQVETNRHEPGEVDRYRIYATATAHRSELLDPRNPLVSIVDYEKHLCWFMRQDGTYIEDPLDPVTHYCSPVEVPPALEPRADLGGVLATRPCEGYDLSRRLGSGTVAGRATQKWACGHSATRREAVHWFDPAWGLVLRETTDDGTTIELREVRFGPQDPALFRLPPGLRKVPRLKPPF